MAFEIILVSKIHWCQNWLQYLSAVYIFIACSIYANIGLQLKSPSAKSSKQNSFEDYDNEDVEFDEIPQIQADFKLSEHQLRTREACLQEFENLQREISDIHDVFYKLNGAVGDQAQHVDNVEANVEATQVSVDHAEKSLKQALTYKKAMYPLCGAMLGFCIAGPIGMVTFGLKAGSLAAVSCGILGATGGTVIKNREETGASDVADASEVAATTGEEQTTGWLCGSCSICWNCMSHYAWMLIFENIIQTKEILFAIIRQPELMAFSYTNFINIKFLINKQIPYIMYIYVSLISNETIYLYTEPKPMYVAHIQYIIHNSLSSAKSKPIVGNN